MTVEALLERLCEVIPAAVADAGMKQDTCILQTRVALHILRQHGVLARALPVKVAAMNAAYYRLHQERADTEGRTGVDPLEDPDVQRAWKVAGAWCVNLGFGTDPKALRPGWDGHLVAVVQNRWLLDLTLDQASRPWKGIVLRPSVFDAPDFANGRHPIVGAP